MFDLTWLEKQLPETGSQCLKKLLNASIGTVAQAADANAAATMCWFKNRGDMAAGRPRLRIMLRLGEKSAVLPPQSGRQVRCKEAHVAIRDVLLLGLEQRLYDCGAE